MLENNLLTVFQYKLEDIFEGNGELVQINRLKRYASEVTKWKAKIKTERISYLASKKINHLVNLFDSFEDKPDLIINLKKTLHLLETLHIKPDIEELQEKVFLRLKHVELPEPEYSRTLKLARSINLDTELFTSRSNE